MEEIIGIEGDGKMQHVFLVGAKSLGAYGGYETLSLIHISFGMSHDS